ncbi:MAG: hypothetical protein RLY93_03120 [Sumerlaeia bacterium]
MSMFEGMGAATLVTIGSLGLALTVGYVLIRLFASRKARHTSGPEEGKSRARSDLDRELEAEIAAVEARRRAETKAGPATDPAKG